MKLLSAAIFFCTLGVFLLHTNASSAAAITASPTAVTQPTSSAALQTSATETEQQSILPPLILATFALTLTTYNFLRRRRSKDSDT